MRKPFCKYQAYFDSPKSFVYTLRMEFSWNHAKYLEMVSLVRQAIDEHRDKAVLPKSIVFFFVWEIDFIVGTITNDLFMRGMPSRVEKQKLEQLVESGHSELLDLKSEFFAGHWN